MILSVGTQPILSNNKKQGGLMAKFKDDDGKLPSGSTANAVTITAAMYFGKDGYQGYDNPDQFMAYGMTLADSDVEELRKGIQFMKDGLKTNGGSGIRKDVAGKQYRYYTFLLPKSRPGAKVIVNVGVIRLIDDYQHGRIAIDFTLDELIEEAKKLNIHN